MSVKTSTTDDKPKLPLPAPAGSATPITDASAKRALAKLLACQNGGDFGTAVKELVKDLLDTARKLETELVEAKTPNSELSSERAAEQQQQTGADARRLLE
jgi:hypothetical protein